MVRVVFPYVCFLHEAYRIPADVLGSGSTQATTVASDADKDDPFWDALNAEVKNLHGVISGHGTFEPLLSFDVAPQRCWIGCS